MTRESPVRIAMWSGPRTISTAMMRSWGNRPDTVVCDEPFYAHYLRHTGLDHPGATEIIERHETDWRQVVAWITGDPPEGKTIFYQKQMAHHLLPHIDTGWLSEVRHVFLIRDPGEMLTSLIRHLPEPTLADTGLPQQVAIFDRMLLETGVVPPVLDARDVLEEPRRLLSLLTDALGVDFTDAMLSWPPGRRETDGIWAKHWYANVERSTGFQPYKPKPDRLPEPLAALHAKCMECYEKLYGHRLGQKTR